MLKTNFLHIVITLILISIYPWLETLAFETQLQITLAMIFLLGIPHGAIDHVLLRKKHQTKKDQFKFYSFYLGLIGVYVGLWVFMPYLSLTLFFLISFYHFGQSQFSDVNIPEKSTIKKLLYLSWGGSIISGLFFHHYDRLIGFFSETSHFAATSSVITLNNLKYFFLISSAITITLMVLLLIGKTKNKNRFGTELMIFLLLHLAFFTIPPLLAFALYFAIWHSLKVLYQEYVFLDQKRKKFDFSKFIKELLPFSAISIIGASLLLFAFSYFEFNISPFFLTIIFLSVLTLPHSIVMDNWYQKFQNKA
ncbi:Brp/Blh family beta-carotene 15,15'-dioxygenase [Marivirga salinae]|uniref:Probable beta-carotene 15,15'-dioxygenase n=1 Tax=Marivirga salinarum TaxID=3059078 RepID=A0AA49GER3_9BACT|nr:Brp/Blh family beta-carotene 15,15'-dioxygenase [Marivirga sp. BDSF4-3]WKK76602.2 Brp/Blh family beta-carotene 15,15'-dioxygenase [Marivirga sp. BDSF4-3]